MSSSVAVAWAQSYGTVTIGKTLELKYNATGYKCKDKNDDPTGAGAPQATVMGLGWTLVIAAVLVVLTSTVL